MKQHLLKQGVFLFAIVLLLSGAVPCQAMIMKPPKEVSSMGELLTWYHGLTGTTFQECVVTAPAICTGEVVLAPTSCRVDIVFLKGLHVPSGMKLTVDNPNLVLMGPPPAIVVEPGGTLQISRMNPLTDAAMPQGGIMVKKGGTLLVETGITLPDGLVENQNPPPNILPPIVNPKPPESELPADEPEPPAGPEPPAPKPPEPIEPEKPGDGTGATYPAEKLSLYGEVLKVTEKDVLFALLTVPFVDPLLTESVTIERSRDAQTWHTEYLFRWNENGQDYQAENEQLGILCSHNRIDRSKTDFSYLSMLSGAPFYLRITLTGVDGTIAVSNPIYLTELPVGQYLGNEDYENNEGNRGGGGQGTSDREPLKEAAASGGNGSLPATAEEEPSSFKRASLSAGSDFPSGPHKETEAVFPSPSQVGADVSLLQAVAGKPLTSVEEQVQTMDEGAVSHDREDVSTAGQADQQEEKAAPDSADRSGLATSVTLALCGMIWAVTQIKSFKRKKS